MKRRVFLELAENVTDTHCGDCNGQSVDQNEGTVSCFYGVLGRFTDPVIVANTLRLTACVENEKLAAQEEKDAAFGRFARTGLNLAGHSPLRDALLDYIRKETP